MYSPLTVAIAAPRPPPPERAKAVGDSSGSGGGAKRNPGRPNMHDEREEEQEAFVELTEEEILHKPKIDTFDGSLSQVCYKRFAVLRLIPYCGS